MEPPPPSHRRKKPKPKVKKKKKVRCWFPLGAVPSEYSAPSTSRRRFPTRPKGAAAAAINCRDAAAASSLNSADWAGRAMMETPPPQWVIDGRFYCNSLAVLSVFPKGFRARSLFLFSFENGFHRVAIADEEVLLGFFSRFSRTWSTFYWVRMGYTE